MRTRTKSRGDARGLRAGVGYGLALFGGRFTGTPNLSVGPVDGEARDYRIGWRPLSAVPNERGFEMRLEAARREAAHGSETEDGVTLRAAGRWQGRRARIAPPEHVSGPGWTGDNVCLHNLRHSCASRALALGEPPPVIGKLFGHTKIQTTARYAHLARDSVRHAANRVAASIATHILPPEKPMRRR